MASVGRRLADIDRDIADRLQRQREARSLVRRSMQLILDEGKAIDELLKLRHELAQPPMIAR